MKRKDTYLLLTLATLVLAFCSCNRDRQKEAIREAAYGYIITTGNYQLDEAAAYASKVTREHTLPFLKDTILPLVDSSFLAASVPATATIDTILVKNDTAWVGYTKTTPLGKTQGTLTMVQEEGKWLAYVPLDLPAPATPSEEP